MVPSSSMTALVLKSKIIHVTKYKWREERDGKTVRRKEREYQY